MFFDPHDYLERDPATARDKVEAARLVREAEQRARLCEAMTRLAAQRGFRAVYPQRVFGAAEVGSGTFYKLFEDREACLREAFERCAEVIFTRVATAAQASGDDFTRRLEAGLGELVDILASDPDVGRLLLVEIRVGDSGCREAQQRWLGRFAGLLEACRGAAADDDETARMVVDALVFLLGQRVADDGPRTLPQMLPELVFVALAPYFGTATAAAEQSLAAVRLPR